MNEWTDGRRCQRRIGYLGRFRHIIRAAVRRADHTAGHREGCGCGGVGSLVLERDPCDAAQAGRIQVSHYGKETRQEEPDVPVYGVGVGERGGMGGCEVATRERWNRGSDCVWDNVLGVKCPWDRASFRRRRIQPTTHSTTSRAGPSLSLSSSLSHTHTRARTRTHTRTHTLLFYESVLGLRLDAAVV